MGLIPFVTWKYYVLENKMNTALKSLNDLKRQIEDKKIKISCFNEIFETISFALTTPAANTGDEPLGYLAQYPDGSGVFYQSKQQAEAHAQKAFTKCVSIPIYAALQRPEPSEGGDLYQLCHDAYEIYAGMDGGIPETAYEGYLLQHITEMATLVGQAKRAALAIRQVDDTSVIDFALAELYEMACSKSNIDGEKANRYWKTISEYIHRLNQRGLIGNAQTPPAQPDEVAE
jgi:hypothetical protein